MGKATVDDVNNAILKDFDSDRRHWSKLRPSERTMTYRRQRVKNKETFLHVAKDRSSGKPPRKSYRGSAPAGTHQSFLRSNTAYQAHNLHIDAELDEFSYALRKKALVTAARKKARGRPGATSAMPTRGFAVRRHVADDVATTNAIHISRGVAVERRLAEDNAANSHSFFILCVWILVAIYFLTVHLQN